MTGGFTGRDSLSGWFDLQLAFAHALAASTDTSFTVAVTRSTNLYRRCGFGSARDAQLDPRWLAYLDMLEQTPGRTEQLALTMALIQDRFRPFAEHVTPHHEGCFAFEPPDGQGRVRLHFAPLDSDDAGGPLGAAKADRRRAELKRLFEKLYRAYPQAELVRGTSWLYHRQSYLRLFPIEYATSRRIHTGDSLRYSGGSSWGQFLDHRGRLQRALADRFRHNLPTLEPQAVWKCFPMPAMIAEAPATAFYHHFAIES